MENFNSHLPTSHRISYSLNEYGRYYKEPSKIAFTTLPEYLKCEKTQTHVPIINGAETVIHGPIKKGKYTFYTGLRNTDILNWQYGNDAEIRNGRKFNSLVLFHCANNDGYLIVHYFMGCYHHDRKRLEKLIPTIISNVLQHETA